MRRDSTPNLKTHPNMFRWRSLFTASRKKTLSCDLSLKLCCTSGTFQKWIKQSCLWLVELPWNGVRCHYLLGHCKRLIAWTEYFSFTMGPWTEPENTHVIWTHNHPVLFIQLCHNILCLSFSVFFVLCNVSSQQRNSSCWLHACDHERITPLLNICYLRSHMVKGKGRKRPSYSRRNTLTYCACRHSAWTLFWMIVNCFLFSLCSFENSRSRPACSAPPSSVPWAPRISTATTSQWSTPPVRWVSLFNVLFIECWTQDVKCSLSPWLLWPPIVIYIGFHYCCFLNIWMVEEHSHSQICNNEADKALWWRSKKSTQYFF